MEKQKISFATEKFMDVIDEIKPLLLKHWEEIEGHRDIIKLNPDYDKYHTLEKSGMLHIVTARYDGKLIGYSISFVVPHLHYPDCLMSLNDIVYLSPEYRKGRNAIQLFEYAEEELKFLGVMKVHYDVSIKRDFGPVLQSIGYTLISHTYEKLINREVNTWPQ